MSIKRRSYLVNLNRVFIFALTLTGLLMDGYQASDLPCTFALIVWLWLPYCTRIEAKILKHISAIRDHSVHASLR
jgi:hypothetical protein